MGLKDSFGRNLNIDKKSKKLYDDILSGLCFQGFEKKYVFMLSLALAYNRKLKPKKIERYPLLNTESFSRKDVWLMAAVAVEHTGSLSILNDLNEVRKIAEEYAMAGLQELKSLIDDNGSGDNFLSVIEVESRKRLNK